MPNTGFVNATKFGVYIGGTLVNYSTNCSLEISMDTREVTNKESGGNAEFRESKKSWSGSGEFIFAPDATYGFEDLFALWQARTMVTVRFSTETVGDKYYQGSAYITSLPATFPVEDNVTFTMSLQGTGALTEYTGT
jgi:predicted secreted protein